VCAAGAVTAACMGVLLVGLQLGKQMISFFTILKVPLPCHPLI
jgi:hypothetical protein